MRTSQHPFNHHLRPNRIEFETPSAALAVVSLVGEHDLSDYKPLQQALELAASRRRHMIVDLSACEFIDSTVISLLLNAQGEVVSDGGCFGVVIPHRPGAVRRVAELMQFESLFPVYASLETAQSSAVATSDPRSSSRAAVVSAGPDYFSA
jgi:anti-anti-sigma factor